jgi:hypothetical protein
MSEAWICKKLVQYARLKKWPLFHISNEGKRNPGWSQAIGIVAGVSDYFLPIPSFPYSGLWIEMKDYGKKPTRKQLVFLELMKRYGFATACFDDWLEAVEFIELYLEQNHLEV